MGGKTKDEQTKEQHKKKQMKRMAQPL
jgi:hypothetical protein